MDPHSQQQARYFDTVIGTHFTALYRAAMRLTRSHADAEDLVQDVVMRAMPEIGRLATLDSPLAWLLRVQYRLFVDGVRHRRRSPVDDADGHAILARAVSEAPGPEQLTEESLHQRRIARAWQQLPREQRALLAMHAEGYSLGELEVMTGLSRNAIGVRLHRVRARLAQLLDAANTEQLMEG